MDSSQILQTNPSTNSCYYRPAKMFFGLNNTFYNLDSCSLVTLHIQDNTEQILPLSFWSSRLRASTKILSCLFHKTSQLCSPNLAATNVCPVTVQIFQLFHHTIMDQQLPQTVDYKYDKKSQGYLNFFNRQQFIIKRKKMAIRNKHQGNLIFYPLPNSPSDWPVLVQNLF